MTGTHITEGSLRRLSLPVFGLPPSWQGDRWFGTDKIAVSGSGEAEILSLQLGHGWRDSIAVRSLIVRSTAPDPYADRYTPHVVSGESPDQAIDELRHRWGLPVPAGFLPTESPLTVVVEGDPTSFSAIRSEEWWIALHTASSVSIMVIARRFDVADVELVAISNFHHYVEDLQGWSPSRDAGGVMVGSDALSSVSVTDEG